MIHVGVMLPPWDVGDWAAAVGVRPDTAAVFESWGRQRIPTQMLAAADAAGLDAFVLTWEPWDRGWAGAGELDVSCDAIASGRHDEYVAGVLAALQATRIHRPYVRLAHEMQGSWYPWSADPVAYVAAWRRVAGIARRVAPRVRLLWSPNPDLYRLFGAYLEVVRPYWPGREHVDRVGVTAINFGGVKAQAPQRFAQRGLGLARTYGKALVLPEVNTCWDGRAAWLGGMRSWSLEHARDLEALVLSQPAVSGGQSSIPGVGHVQWRVEADAAREDGSALPVVCEWFTTALALP